MGRQYKTLAAQEVEASDLALLELHTKEAVGRIVATVSNSGNRLAPTEAIVRFYEGPTFAGAKQIGEDVAVSLAGCGLTQQVTTEWELPEREEPTTYRVWAEICEPSFADENPDNDTIT